jgi:hypothetical protein
MAIITLLYDAIHDIRGLGSVVYDRSVRWQTVNDARSERSNKFKHAHWYIRIQSRDKAETIK